ncbi:beta-ketoacyl-ACP synthase III [Uliginosibacterium gangwonense]|uniref:beta-ketoacyl-ACP synthase III n=1 Tax=Uliginosibacterium gangwonense TaxID=392736 RepID=UPI00036AE9DE|nr:beta-ketoacyl-ACP synthase III [Uliginosibacterium gangwonense]
MTSEVYITRTAAFLPFAPVYNDEIETVLGMVGNRPSRARRLILKSNGIQSRHYAIDRASGKNAMSNAQMTAEAIRELGDVGPIDCLATGTSVPDQLMPNHAVMVHGELKWPRLEAVAFAGICLAGTAALKHAWLSVRSGEAQRAVATGSELASPALRGHFFQAETAHQIDVLQTQPQIAFEKDFLRWMLSDGAGAMLLESIPRGPLSLRIEWIELSSAAHELPACMYMGADKDEGHALHSWRHTPQTEWGTRSFFAVKQDVKLLNDNIVRATLRDPLQALMDKRKLNAENIDWFLPHISSMYFAEPVEQALKEIGLPIPRERWFTNLTTRGNTGSASPYIMLDELFRSGHVHRGQRLLMFVPESGRFSCGFVMLEAV